MTKRNKTKSTRWWLWSVGVFDEGSRELGCWKGLVSAGSGVEAHARASAHVLDLVISDGAWNPDDKNRSWSIDDLDEAIEFLAKQGVLVGDYEGIIVQELPLPLTEGVL